MKTIFGDKRDITYAERKKIGFVNSRKNWQNALPIFTKHTLSIAGHPVMEDWETGYMRELAMVACKNGGSILEIGFGMGISARFIQKNKIKEHFIIEANSAVFKKLLVFGTKSTIPVFPFYGFWEDITKTFPSKRFDGILFDTYPLRAEEIHQNHFSFFKEAYRLLKPNGVLTYYSDEADSFSKKHLRLLTRASFQKIDMKIFAVNPPKNCKYWKYKTFLVPVINK